MRWLGGAALLLALLWVALQPTETADVVTIEPVATTTTSTSTTTTIPIPPTTTTTEAPPEPPMTTTTVARARSAPIAPEPAPEAPEGIWDDLAGCESGGRWDAAEPPHEGGLQFLPSTWRAAGGTAFAAHAYEATREQQIEVAKRWLARTSPSQWPVCGPRVGLTMAAAR